MSLHSSHVQSPTARHRHFLAESKLGADVGLQDEVVVDAGGHVREPLARTPSQSTSAGNWGQTTAFRISACSVRLASDRRCSTSFPAPSWHSSQVTACEEAALAAATEAARTRRNFIAVLRS